MPQSTYRDQFVKLVNRGYLVRRGDSNAYDFYETPQHATRKESDSTVDGYDFTNTDVSTPQTVYDKTANSREINIDNINIINKQEQAPVAASKEFRF